MVSAILEIVSHYTLLAIEKTGYLGVFFLMFLESANIPIPSEIIMPFSGFLSAVWEISLARFFLIGSVILSEKAFFIGIIIKYQTKLKERNNGLTVSAITLFFFPAFCRLSALSFLSHWVF